jgi:hypothetical protein
VALEDMMGLTFAEAFVEFVTEKKNLAAKAVSKVESNPDQSKHLETAKTTVLNTELDFVNLRSEEYAEDSRIPTEVVILHALPLGKYHMLTTSHKDIWYSSPRCASSRHHHQRAVL